MSRHRADLREVEQSPDGRYVRFDEKLGNGAYKEVYLAYDTETGKEVAWNTVEMRRLPAAEKRRIRSETEILSELEHPHIINFYHVWENKERDQICFTTEIVTSGTLKQYTNRVKSIKLKVIKKWCRQILTSLDYLHSHEPPIIHRDLKCDNIFINGGTGEIRLGDFGLSAHRTCTHVASVLGTPEFMAPELYEENYSEKVDIYAFGMTVLEMTTKEYPYEECSNAAQIWKKVTGGQKPDVLHRIHDPQVRAFIELCLAPEELRLSASELLQHPFLAFRKSDNFVRDNLVVTVEPKSHAGSGPGSKATSATNIQDKYRIEPIPTPTPTTTTKSIKPRGVPTDGVNPPPVVVTPSPLVTNPNLLDPFFVGGGNGTATTPSNASQTQTQTGVSAILVEIESASGPTANIVLHIHLDGGRRKKQIKFALDFRHDTSMSLAGEMVQSLKLPDGERTTMLIASTMEAKIEPVRKAYFAQMTEVGEQSVDGEMDEAAILTQIEQQQQQHQQPGYHDPFVHTSYSATPSPAHRADPHATMPFTPSANKSIYQTAPSPLSRTDIASTLGVTIINSTNNGANSKSTQAQPRTLNTKPTQSPTALLPTHPPSGTPLQYPSRPPNGTNKPPTLDTGSRSSTPITRPSLPTANSLPITGSNHPPPSSNNPPTRPSTAHTPSTHQRNSQPPTPSVQLTGTERGHRPTMSLGGPTMSFSELDLGLGIGSASPCNAQQQAPSSTRPSAVHEEGGLLTLDAFECSEEYEAYLHGELKCLSVSALKEKLRNKPGGHELVKACFEKPDLIDLLLRIILQEQATKGKNVAAGPTSTTNNNNHNINNHNINNMHPHQSFTTSAISPDFLSPEPPSPMYPSSIATTTTSSMHQQQSPDPFSGLDAMMGNTPTTTTTTNLNNMHHHQDDSHQHPHQHRHHPDSTRAPNPHTSHHHVHHSLDALATPTFVFSPTGSDSSNGSLMNEPISINSAIPSHDLRSNRTVDSTTSQHDTAFDFQVSVTSPVQTPDVGLDGGLDGGLDLPPSTSHAQSSPPDFLSPSPNSAPPVTRGNLNLNVGHSHLHSGGIDALTPSGEPNSAPSKANGQFPYDLLANGGGGGGGGSANHTPTHSNGGGLHSNNTSSVPRHNRTASTDRDRNRNRIAPSLSGVMEDATEGSENGSHHPQSNGGPRTPAASKLRENGMNGHRSELSTVSDRSDDSDLSDLMADASRKAESAQSMSHPAAARRLSLDPELNAFFAQPRKTDSTQPTSANQVPQATPSSHQAKLELLQQRTSGMRTLPANFSLNDLGDMFGQTSNPTSAQTTPSPSQQQQQQSNPAINANGTKGQRSHTVQVDNFDPLSFFSPSPSPSPSPNPQHHSQSVNIPMTKNNATSVFDALGTPHPNTTTKETIEHKKQQRTKSEADQAEAAILHGFQI